MGYGNIDAHTKPIDTLFALVHSTTRLLNPCLFSFRYVSSIFFFIIVASASPLIVGLRAESGLSNERTRFVRPVLLFPLEEAKFIILSSHGCCQSWCASGDELEMFATMWWWHGWDCRIASSRPVLCLSLPHTHTYWQLAVLWELLSFLLYLPFICLPHLHFCFVSQLFGDEWHCLTSMRLSFPLPLPLPPPPPTRWWYPASYPSHGLTSTWLTSKHTERFSYNH